MKTIEKLLIEQYGHDCRYDDYDYGDKFNEDNYWKSLQFDYNQASTKDLLKTLNSIRIDISKIFSVEYEPHIKKLLKIKSGLKRILKTREHIKNKQERKLDRKRGLI